jgi:hypothetical protein
MTLIKNMKIPKIFKLSDNPTPKEAIQWLLSGTLVAAITYGALMIVFPKVRQDTLKALQKWTQPEPPPIPIENPNNPYSSHR